jgi:hypothetical protein
MSAVPPGANGTTSRITLLGYAPCACATPTTPNIAHARLATTTDALNIFVISGGFIRM